ncbi:MAG: four helix bundle protein [Prevotella sp.]|nr:four helix bundle protein [Prevotella sp.]
MLPRKENIIIAKSDVYSNRILKLYQYLTDVKHEFVISKQIMRSGTSIGANVAESRNAQGEKDFINKLNITLKEADETEFWLKKLLHGDYITQYQYESMYQDNDEIVKILTKIIKTMKSKLNS